MSLEKYLVDVLGIKKIFLDPQFIEEQHVLQEKAEPVENVFTKHLEELKHSTAKSLFIVEQNDLSEAETIMLQKMAEALNWKSDHQMILLPENISPEMQKLLLDEILHWLKKSLERKLIVFTENKTFAESPQMIPFFDVHHARICEIPRLISNSPALKKTTWEKIKILKNQ